MHISSKIIIPYFSGDDFPPLSTGRTGSVSEASEIDAAWSYRSSILSLVSALTSLDSGYRSWPVVQLYYSTFYSIKSILYSNQICIFYKDGKPYRLDVSPGAIASKLTFKGAGNSHFAAGRIFEDRFPNHPLNGDIDFTRAFAWLRGKREKVNYGEPLMNMDDWMTCFSEISNRGVRSTFNTYNSDLRLYAYLEDHAVLAFPLYAATLARNTLSEKARTDIRPQTTDILQRLKDKSGQIVASELQP